MDTNRVTVVYFAVVGLDLLNALDAIADRASVVEWIYAQQLVSQEYMIERSSGASAPASAFDEYPLGKGARGVTGEEICARAVCVSKSVAAGAVPRLQQLRAVAAASKAHHFLGDRSYRRPRQHRASRATPLTAPTSLQRTPRWPRWSHLVSATQGTAAPAPSLFFSAKTCLFVRHAVCRGCAVVLAGLCVRGAAGDDLSRVDRAGIVQSLRRLQRDDGWSVHCL